MTDAPRADEIEVSLCGRGQGEAVLIHYGDGQWVLIDCLRNGDGSVAPLHYLREIGHAPRDALRAIVATHWHDDHIQGLAEVYKEASNARLIVPIAMRSKELEAFQARARKGGTEKISSGVRELDRIAIVQRDEKRTALKAVVANTVLLRTSPDDLSHGHTVSIEALSPSHADVEAFLRSVSAAGDPPSGGRVEPFSQNDVSIAIWVSIGEHRILLGADLETTTNPERGWDAVLHSSAKLDGKAGVLKVPHHGSQNGHHPSVWTDLLIPEPVAALTTYNGGKTKLPTESDVARITGLTPKAFVTSTLLKKPASRLRSVEKRIERAGITIRRLPERAGHIRLRLNLASKAPEWEVKLLHSACPLTDLQLQATA